MNIRITPAIKWLMIVSGVIFLIQQTADQFFGAGLAGVLGLSIPGFLGHKFLWQIATYSLVHADVSHLVLNLLMLAFIGSEIEALWGTKRFLGYYFSCLFFAAFCYLVIALVVSTPAGLLVGASGGIYGLLVAYGILFSERMLLFMMLFPMKAKHFVWILAAVEFLTTVYSSRSGWSGIAHLAGMCGGFLILMGAAYVKRSGSSGPARKPRRKSSHLKLISGEGGAGGGGDDTGETGRKTSSGQSDGPKPPTWH